MIKQQRGMLLPLYKEINFFNEITKHPLPSSSSFRMGSCLLRKKDEMQSTLVPVLISLLTKLSSNMMVKLILLCLTLVPLIDANDEILQCITANSNQCFRDLADKNFSPYELAQIVFDGENREGLCQLATDYDKDLHNCLENSGSETHDCFKNEFGVGERTVKEIFKLYSNIIENTQDYLCNNVTDDEVKSLKLHSDGDTCFRRFGDNCPVYKTIIDFPYGLLSDRFWLKNQLDYVCESYIEFAKCSRRISESCHGTFYFTLNLLRAQLDGTVCNHLFYLSSGVNWKSFNIYLIVFLSILFNKML